MLISTGAAVGSLLLERYLSHVGPTIMWTLVESDGEVLTSTSAVNTHAVTSQEKRTIYLIWIADHINLLALSYSLGHGARLAKSATFFTDNSLGGQIVKKLLDRKNARVINLSISPADRIRSLRAAYNTTGPLVLAVDGGGPYFQVAPSVVNLARAIGAEIVPMSILANSALVLPRRMGLVSIPRKGAEVRVRLGSPISTVRQVPAEVAGRIVQALTTLRDTE